LPRRDKEKPENIAQGNWFPPKLKSSAFLKRVSEPVAVDVNITGKNDEITEVADFVLAEAAGVVLPALLELVPIEMIFKLVAGDGIAPTRTGSKPVGLLLADPAL
jgi:hypothetical protein